MHASARVATRRRSARTRAGPDRGRGGSRRGRDGRPSSARSRRSETGRAFRWLCRSPTAGRSSTSTGPAAPRPRLRSSSRERLQPIGEEPPQAIMTVEEGHVGDSERPHVPPGVVVKVRQHLVESALVPELESASREVGVRGLLHAEELIRDRFPHPARGPSLPTVRPRGLDSGAGRERVEGPRRRRVRLPRLLSDRDLSPLERLR